MIREGELGWGDNSEMAARQNFNQHFPSRSFKRFQLMARLRRDIRNLSCGRSRLTGEFGSHEAMR
jgi:hypothetical protein